MKNFLGEFLEEFTYLKEALVNLFEDSLEDFFLNFCPLWNFGNKNIEDFVNSTINRYIYFIEYILIHVFGIRVLVHN